SRNGRATWDRAIRDKGFPLLSDAPSDRETHSYLQCISGICRKGSRAGLCSLFDTPERRRKAATSVAWRFLFLWQVAWRPANGSPLESVGRDHCSTRSAGLPPRCPFQTGLAAGRGLAGESSPLCGLRNLALLWRSQPRSPAPPAKTPVPIPPGPPGERRSPLLKHAPSGFVCYPVA